jgi:hypothetical protein
MTRSKKIGYSHAALTTAWFSIAALDSSQLVNGVLGDAVCTTISVFLAVPLSWLAAMVIGFTSFPSMPEHFIRMIIMGAVIIVNGRLIGYFVSRALTWAGIPERSAPDKAKKQAEQGGDGDAEEAV